MIPLELYKAIDRATANFDPVIKDAENPHFKSKFSSLSSIRKAVEPALHAEGISLKYFLSNDVLILRVVHIPSGEYEDHEAPMFGENAQQYGASSTYQRRYLLQVALNLAAVDDDGESAMGRGTTPDTKQATPATMVNRKTF
jgi:hypothetical protein